MANMKIEVLAVIWTGLWSIPVTGWLLRGQRQLQTCEVTAWSAWTECTGDCSSGITHRFRYVPASRRSNSFYRCRKPVLSVTKTCHPPTCQSDCIWGEWGHWTECDPCQGGKMSRSRKILRPAMFGGQVCEGSEFSVSSCVPLYNCQRPEVNCTALELFACRAGDECIEHYLLCNGDSDCQDRSDERSCEPDTTIDTCFSLNYSDLPNSYLIGSGYDILRDSVSGQALDNNQFQGYCNTVFIAELGKLYRKPFNLQMYRSLVKTQTSLNSYLFKDTLSMSDTKVSEFEFKIDSRPTSISPIISGSTAARTNSKLWKKIIESNSEGHYTYVKVESKIEIGHFKMRRGDLKVSRYFKERTRKLPRKYDAAVYSHFISDFGTHYFTEGKLGGVYEIIHRVGTKKMTSTNTNEQKSQMCLLMKHLKKIVGRYNLTDLPTPCEKDDDDQLNTNTFSHDITDSISVAHGGYSSAAADLTYEGKDASQSTYRLWARSVPRSPTIFDFKISPISELVDDFDIRKNIDLALQDLYAKFDPKNCDSTLKCLNGGKFVVLNNGRECKCVCKSPHYGKRCEKRSE